MPRKKAFINKVKKEEVKEIFYRFNAVEDISFSFSIPDYLKNQNQIDREKIRFQVGLSIDINVEKKILLIILQFKLFYENGVSEDKLMAYSNRTSFQISNFDKVVDNLNEDEGIFNFPENIMVSLSGIAISTARGIIIEKTSTLPFGSINIPIITRKQIEELLHPNKLYLP